MNFELTVTNEITILIQTIKEEIKKGKERIEHTIANEKTTTCWNIGKYIHEHLLNHKDRADYGEQLFKVIAQQLNTHARALYTAVQFYEAYPRILPARAQLTWSHYKILVTIEDEDIRKKYEQQIINENLSTCELQKLIKKDKAVNSNNKFPKLKESMAQLHTYKLKLIKMTLIPWILIWVLELMQTGWIIKKNIQRIRLSG